MSRQFASLYLVSHTQPIIQAAGHPVTGYYLPTPPLILCKHRNAFAELLPVTNVTKVKGENHMVWQVLTHVSLQFC